MGPVVVMTANKRQAWSSLRASKNKKDVLGVGNLTRGKNNFVLREVVTPRAPSSRQRDLTKALINFTADPANEIGLIPYFQMEKLLNRAYFDKHFEMQGTDGKWKRVEIKKSDKIYMPGKEFSREKLIGNVNSAFFGQNRTQKRM